MVPHFHLVLSNAFSVLLDIIALPTFCFALACTLSLPLLAYIEGFVHHEAVREGQERR